MGRAQLRGGAGLKTGGDEAYCRRNHEKEESGLEWGECGEEQTK